MLSLKLIFVKLMYYCTIYIYYLSMNAVYRGNVVTIITIITILIDHGTIPLYIILHY